MIAWLLAAILAVLVIGIWPALWALVGHAGRLADAAEAQTRLHASWFEAQEGHPFQ